tara:strand:+ start:287 stop:619 length:333 start_codon:yes stop_codon:yes gene_type:complete
MTRRYDFTTSRGFLTGIKITTEQHIRSNQLDKKWIDGDFLELLLLIDDTWRTPRQIINRSDYLRTQVERTQIMSFLKKLKDDGYIEHRRVSNKHAEYRRANSFPKHEVER